MIWQLGEWSDNLDTTEIDNEVQIRHHNVFSRYAMVLASAAITTSDVGKTLSSVSYYVGGKSYSKTIVGAASAGKYICVKDGTAPQQPGTPGDYVLREQVYEYYGEWEDAPAGWGENV